MKNLMIVVVLVLLGGCAAPHPPLSRDEFLAVTHHSYEGKSPEQIFSAAERLFKYSDGNDYSFTYSDTSLNAQRRWSFYAVLAAGFGTDSWVIKATPQDGGVLATVEITTSSSQVFGPTMLGTYGGTAIYDVFWSRMDYLLGLSKHWMNCEEVAARVKSGMVWGEVGPLCDNVTVNDNSPPEATSDPQTPIPARAGTNIN